MAGRETPNGEIGLWEPELPQPDTDGNYPALEALAVLQARDILMRS